MVPAPSQGDLILCSIYLRASVRDPGEREGGAGVQFYLLSLLPSRSRSESKAPTEEYPDYLCLQQCKAHGDVGTTQHLRAILPQEVGQCCAMGEVPGQKWVNFGTGAMVITMVWALDAVTGVGGWKCSRVAASWLCCLSISLPIWLLFHSGALKTRSPILPSV